MKPFVTLGDLIADLYLGLERFPVLPAQHQEVSGLTLGPGGAGNSLIAAARLGLPAVALGGIGGDWIGDRVLGQLHAEGVDVSAVTRMAGEATAVAVVLRAQNGEHVFLGHYGTRGPRNLPEAYRPALESAGILLVDGWAYRHDWPELILAGAQTAAEAGVSVLFDPGPLAPELERGWLTALLDGTHVLLATEPEAAALAQTLGAAGWEALASERRAVVLKRGAQGCLIRAEGETKACPGYPAEVRDLNAAGDCFAAAVAWGLLTGQSWDVVGAVANAVGAAKVQKIGSALAAPTRAEAAAVLRQQRPDLAALLA